MSIKINDEEKALRVYLSGEIDHHSASFLREQIDKRITISRNKTVILDFEKVIFMDSSAIGLVMGRYKTAKSCGSRIVIRGLNERNSMLMRMAGLDKIIEFEVQ